MKNIFEAVKAELNLEEGIGNLKGLPISWVKLLTKDYKGTGGENSEVRLLGKFKVRSDQERAGKLKTYLQELQTKIRAEKIAFNKLKGIELTPNEVAAIEAGEDVYVSISATSAEQSIWKVIGYYVKSATEPICLFQYDPSNARQFEVVLPEGEAITRKEETSTRRHGYRHTNTVEKKDLNLQQLTGILPLDTELEVYALFSDAKRAEKQAQRYGEKLGQDTDLENIASKAGKKILKQQIAQAKDVISTKLMEDLEMVLDSVEQAFDKVNADGKIEYNEESGLEDRLHRVANRLSTLVELVDALGSLSRDGKIFRIASRGYGKDAKDVRELSRDYEQFKSSLNRLIGKREE